MLVVAEQSPIRLIIHEDRRWWRAVAAVFAVLSLLVLLATAAQGWHRYLAPEGLSVGQMVTLALFMGVEMALVAVAISAALYQGMRVVFDRSREDVCVVRMQGLRMVERRLSLYGVSHVRVEKSPEHRAVALFLVLRSGEALALAALPAHEEEQAQSLARTIRVFLQVR